MLDFRVMMAIYLPKRKVKTNKHMYAAMLRAVRTETTLPLVLNLFRRSPSSPSSEKNCLFPVVLVR